MALKEFLHEVKLINAESGISLTNNETRILVENVFSALANQRAVRIPEFGSFKWKTRSARPARVGRNPSTGEALNIAAKPETEFLAFKQAK